MKKQLHQNDNYNKQDKITILKKLKWKKQVKVKSFKLKIIMKCKEKSNKPDTMKKRISRRKNIRKLLKNMKEDFNRKVKTIKKKLKELRVNIVMK